MREPSCSDLKLDLMEQSASLLSQVSLREPAIIDTVKLWGGPSSKFGGAQLRDRGRGCCTPLLSRADGGLPANWGLAVEEVVGLRGRRSLGCSAASRGSSETTPLPSLLFRRGSSSGFLKLEFAQPTSQSPVDPHRAFLREKVSYRVSAHQSSRTQHPYQIDTKDD